MSVASLNDAISALEKRAEVLERGWMANKDVQGRRRAPELPQRGRTSQCRENGRSVNSADGSTLCPKALWTTRGQLGMMPFCGSGVRLRIAERRSRSVDGRADGRARACAGR